MRASEEDDEQFYRDTERIAFPALSDEQLATLDSLGTRRKVRRGEIIYKAGQRVSLTLGISPKARRKRGAEFAKFRLKSNE